MVLENYCKHCGHRLHPDEPYCKECGRKTQYLPTKDNYILDIPVYDIGFFDFDIDFSPYITSSKEDFKYEICSCGYLNDVNNEYCYMCGAKRNHSKFERILKNSSKPQFSIDNVLCDCGAINSRENIFCEMCGKQLKDNGPVKEDKFSGAYGGNKRYLLCGWDISAEEKKVISNFMYGWDETERTFMDQGKLPPKVFFRYYISNGEWYYGQEYYNNLLKEIGLENPLTALFERDDIYLLDMSKDTLFREFFYVYLYDHYGEMTVREVGNINGSPVFEFRR